MSSSPSDRGFARPWSLDPSRTPKPRTDRQGGGSYFSLFTFHFSFFTFHFSLFILSLLLASCSSRPNRVPDTFSEADAPAPIYPDYHDVTVPPNIAPLNFIVQDQGADAFVAEIGNLVCGAGDDGKVDIDTAAWRTLLAQTAGKTLHINVYARRDGQWVRYQPFPIHVANEEIDPYLSYRLIEPGYELYRQLGLYQRNLTNFDETPIYENNRSYEDEENHCVNCHNYQNYDAHRMLFHIRAAHGGTVIVDGEEAHKVAISHDSILAAGVYPSWHPTLPLVAFSTNKTGQVFHMLHPEKIEVMDLASDLLLYDAEHNTVRNILRSTTAFETFPCWAPDGRTLYYCRAASPELAPDEFEGNFIYRYDSIRYDLCSISFDPVTRQFGPPRIEFEASAIGKSASVPRVSPDGRYLLFTLGDYGQFHIWHKSADLWAMPLCGSPGEAQDIPAEPPYPLTDANSSDADSYHAWSSNGRWIVFSSRRDDGDFTRPYIAYFDNRGHAHKPFMLPQRDPEYNILLLKSYNVPELTRNAVRVSRETLNHVVRHTEAQGAAFQQ